MPLKVPPAKDAHWDLAELYNGPDDPRISADLERSMARARKLQADYKGRALEELSPSGFLTALQEYEALQEEGLKPLLYASLLFSENTQNEESKALRQKAQEHWNTLENQILFFRLALIGLAEERLQFFLEDKKIQPYAHALHFLRRFREFTRNEPEEEILSRKNLTGRAAFTTLFDEFTGAFSFRLSVDGEEKELTGSEVLALLYAPERDLRERAFRTFLAYHGENGLVLTSIFNSLLLDARVEDEIRGYSGPMHRSYLENEIRPETVEKMMAATEAHYSLAREYFQVKACLLGLPRLKNTDIYAPLPAKLKEFSFSEAQELLLRSFQAFHPLFGRISRQAFEERWIDAEVRRGKYGGAFCSGMTPALHPYLLMNFTGNLRDALTLAHEMGHAIHFALARKQSLLNFDPPLTLAETASVFGEMVIIQALLQEERDVATRQALLCAEIEDIIATVFRQNVLTRFEEAAHAARRDHLLSSAEIGELWWQANEKLFGETVQMVPEYRWGWSYISHFIHSRFYCYSYIFGELVVLALFQKYQDEGPPFLSRLIHLLESGGSADPEQLLLAAGVDIRQEGVWAQGFQVVRGLIDELKSLGPFAKICLEENL